MAEWAKLKSAGSAEAKAYENELALAEDSKEDESRGILEGSLAKIRQEAARSLYSENILEAAAKASSNGAKQHHVQFNGKEASPSIASSSSSSSSGENSCLDEARPPDGGWGWLVVAASFFVNLIADGITFSFGVIFHEFLEYFGESKATTSWIGSLFMAMPLLSGPIASFLTDRYGCRKVTIAGSALATLGFVVSYFASSMGVLILTFGVLAGFGLSLCFVAAVVIVAYYFDKRRSFATGLSLSGSGIGTFIFPPLIQRLVSEYGWRGATLILAGLFANLAVCGCLMRDLEWTTIRSKEKSEERRRNRQRKRLRLQSSSADSFSAASGSANAAPTDPKRSANPTLLDPAARQQQQQQQQQPSADKPLFSSLVNLPTFVKNGEKVPLEVLELLSNRKNVYNVLVQNYPSLLISSRSFSDSSGLHEQAATPNPRIAAAAAAAAAHPVSPLALEGKKEVGKIDEEEEEETQSKDAPGAESRDSAQLAQNGKQSECPWKRNVCPDAQFRRASVAEHPRRLPTAYLKDIRVHRHSLTYRGAMLNISRYRLRASSCPDIYRNSMTTIAKQKIAGWQSGLWEFWDLLIDMLDFSHFADSGFLLFSISNFLLHTWYDVPYMYLTDNAIEMGFSEADASLLISVIGIMNMAGEILLGWAGDRAWLNPSVVYAVCMAICGAFTALIPTAIKCYYLLSTLAGAFGFFVAANYSLTSIILVEAITLERFTNAYGLLLLVQGVANLMGPPLAGWLYDITGTYDLSFYLSGLFIGLSGLMLLVMPLQDLYRRYRKSSQRASDEAKVEPKFDGINSV